jgi:dihydroxyacetone kinase
LFKEKNIKVFKNYVNNYMTSLEMAGASCSILSLDKELKSLLCDMAYTPAFIKGIN